AEAAKDTTPPALTPPVTATSPVAVAPSTDTAAGDAGKTTTTDKGTPPKSPVKAPNAAAKEPPGMFEDLLGNMPGWAVGVGVLSIIAGIAALLAARRRKTT